LNITISPFSYDAEKSFSLNEIFLDFNILMMVLVVLSNSLLFISSSRTFALISFLVSLAGVRIRVLLRSSFGRLK